MTTTNYSLDLNARRSSTKPLVLDVKSNFKALHRMISGTNDICEEQESNLPTNFAQLVKPTPFNKQSSSSGKILTISCQLDTQTSPYTRSLGISTFESESTGMFGPRLPSSQHLRKLLDATPSPTKMRPRVSYPSLFASPKKNQSPEPRTATNIGGEKMKYLSVTHYQPRGRKLTA